MASTSVLFLLCFMTLGINGSSHWMVTENGLIEPWIDSPFLMANPLDVVAFLNQDTRWDNIINLYFDLMHRIKAVHEQWVSLVKDTDINSQMASDKNCMKAGPLHLIDWYSSIIEDGKSRNIAKEEFYSEHEFQGLEGNIPDCKKISSLTFSMFAFEHLKAMSQRENLTVNPETSSLPIDDFGDWIYGKLKQNSSSWLHYNMASIYWRIKGNAIKATECSRRAVHYAPRIYKDIALLSLGTVFYRSKMRIDAITILKAAVDHAPNIYTHHFMLANAYAVIGDFNSSVKHFDVCLKLNSDYDMARKHKYGLLCHKAITQKMRAVQGSFEKLLHDLEEFDSRYTYWLKSQVAFVRTMKHNEEFDYRNIDNIVNKMSKLTNLSMEDTKKWGYKISLISYYFKSPMYEERWWYENTLGLLETAYTVQKLIEHIDKHTNMAGELFELPENIKKTDGVIKEEIGPLPEFTDVFIGKYAIDWNEYIIAHNRQQTSSDVSKIMKMTESDSYEFKSGLAFYPPTMKVSRNIEDFDREPNWPTSKFCKDKEHTFPSNLEIVYPVFLPFENKGIRLKNLLTEKIGVPASVEHDLPWHPPVCPTEKEASTFNHKTSLKAQFNIKVGPLDHLRSKLLEYVGNGDIRSVAHMQDAEIGQRLYAAMQLESVPKWIVYTMSSLYWRVREHSVNAASCLLSAQRAVPSQLKDVVMTSLASLHLEHGHFTEALIAAEDAFKLSLYEPATNFMLAQINMVKKNRNTQQLHLKQVLRVEPSFMNGIVRNIFNGWACSLNEENYQVSDSFEDQVCTESEPSMSMVCEKDGSNCHVASIQCLHTKNKIESSTLLKMLESNSNSHESPLEPMDDSIFDQFIDNMPEHRSDIVLHGKNYVKMRTTVETQLKGCGDKACSELNPADLNLHEDDCSYQHLLLGYWLHIISFRQLLNDANLRLLTDIMSMTPSENKVPVCEMPVNTGDDFFLNRLSQVDTEDWEPLLSLMHQLAELFNFFDYIKLGAKIAKYVETRGWSWAGLALAGWWCGAAGRGDCAVSCLTAASQHPHAALSLVALLHMQSKLKDAKDVAYLMLYMSPKSKMEAFLVAVSHTYLGEYDQAVWMYRYALRFDEKFLPAKACLHATMCLIFYGDNNKI